MLNYRIRRILGYCWIWTSVFAGFGIGTLIDAAVKSLLHISLSDDAELLLIYGCGGLCMGITLIALICNEFRQKWYTADTDKSNRIWKEIAFIILLNIISTLIFILL